MGKFFVERLKFVLVWIYIVLDLFGLFKIKDEVKKWIIGKVYGVIFNCFGIRVVYIDILLDYSIDKFLMVFCRFVFIRGYLFKIYLDNGF